MKTPRWMCLLIAAALVSCQSGVTTTPATQTPSEAPSASPAPAEPSLPAFTIDWNAPFAPGRMDGQAITLTRWEPRPYAGEEVALPASLGQVANPRVLDGLTSAQNAFLAENGFVVIHSQETQFGDIRVETAHRTGQPYYLTTDAAFHALHLLFDDMLKALEREELRPQMIAITRSTLEQVRAFLPEVRGTAVEAETTQALAYLSVALKLFDSEAVIDPSVAGLVSRQVDQINAGAGKEYSVIFPEFQDDYGAYKPVGHYAGDPELEAYFRGMTWFGRVHFLLADPLKPAFVPSRVPLIVTLALRQGQVDGAPASDSWAALHKTLTFVVGPSDDGGPLEYAALMDSVFGTNPSIGDLADQTQWADFLSRADELPAPKINSLFIDSTKDLASTAGWRFLGQRFTLDGLIIQNLIFDKVEPQIDGTRREFPSGLDVMAAFGSGTALAELEKQGAYAFPNYSDQMKIMQETVQAQPEAQWLARFYDSWLFAFFPVVQGKDASFPAYMRTAAWGYKDLNSVLGSWAELKHDTILYTKMPEGAGGGGPPTSGPAPSMVEPNPEAFYRMAYMARTLSCGLQDLVMRQPCSPGEGGYRGDMSATGLISAMTDLGDRFEALGDIAVKELAGTPLTEEELYSINACLGLTECLNRSTPYNRPNSEMPKVPVVAAVSGSQGSVLEAAVGNVDRIYVLVPLEGRIEVAQGGVFSYYEFTQPRGQRLTDDEWRAKLAAGDAALPAWASQFVFAGGKTTESLFFRVGDVYYITEAGDQLNLREQPSLSGAILKRLVQWEYILIVGGPVQADGHTWWQLGDPFNGPDGAPIGWSMENPDWYARSD
jgi:hypothetical protein